MSNVAVFAVGLLVTLMVAAAMALLICGAVIDGREDEERRADNGHADPVLDQVETVVAGVVGTT